MTVLETAAKAMYARNAVAASGRPPWDKATDLVKAHFVELARAAFESVREPTGAMVAAGNKSKPFNVVGYCEGTIHAVCQRSWPAMIDAALKEDKTQ